PEAAASATESSQEPSSSGGAALALVNSEALPSGAAVSAPAAAFLQGAMAAPQTFLRAPGLTPLPANRRLPPSPPPSPIAVANQKYWEPIDRSGIEAILIGEHHLDPVMMQSEQNFLQNAYPHGARTLVIEYPKDFQRELNDYLKNPTYEKMAAVKMGFEPGMGALRSTPRTRSSWALLLRTVGKALRVVDSTNDPKQWQAAGVKPADVPALLAEIQQIRLWRAAHQMGYRIVAGDIDRQHALDKSGRPIQNPNPGQILAYLVSPKGLTKRNQSIAQAIAEATPRGRVVSIGGAALTGFLRNERLTPSSPPNETYPGLNYLLEKGYGIPSVALAQRAISQQGYVAEKSSGYFHVRDAKGTVRTSSMGEVNREVAARSSQAQALVEKLQT
ncbi:hypothetical protein, partial [Methylacidimicrobium cyclopophantes]|uniref:hypothetical protein n=1 Tax=Methylacidimicrobium cyclopophantes TaxID=1041766 RepID=UPI0015B407FB